MYNARMAGRFEEPGVASSDRRKSALSEQLSQEKLDNLRLMSPTERLVLALELSDTCLELQRACSPKSLPISKSEF
jgi:hypothetical protein